MENIDTKIEEYVCPKCGFIYNPAEGYADDGIEPGTPFAEIPKEWVCPICGLPKWQFERTDEYYS